MAKNSLEALARENLTDKNKVKLRREIICSAISLSCIIVGLIYAKLFPLRTTIPALIYTIGFIIQAVPIFIVSFKGIINKNMTHAMEILVSIAIIACYFNGDLIMSILIPVILNIVHFFEERSIMGGRDVIEGLKRMRQDTAIILDGDREVEIDAKLLKKGQKIVIKPGAGIPIDGKILSGETNLDQKSLTGESLPVHAGAGDMVYAGTVNIDGRIIVEVEKEYIDTSFSKILSLLEKAENITVPESRLMDRFMTYYLPFVLAFAAAVALISTDVNKAIAVLVVSCPCGHLLVSSAPMIAALSVATKHGILIKNSKFIEELTEIDVVVFDKTGTITVGNLELVKAAPAAGVDEKELIEKAYYVASASLHPVSKAVCHAAEKYGCTLSLGEFTVKEISGKGMEGVSADGKHKVSFGNYKWIREMGFDCGEETDFMGPVSYVVFDGKLLGALGFGDTVRPGAARSIKELHENGVTRTVMLTGDRNAAAAAICAETEIDEYYAQLMPEDKLSHIDEIREHHKVVAVGDGINDALALKKADVGIAMGAMGSDTAIQSADIALMNNDLGNIPLVIKLAAQTRNLIYQNMALAICISFVMIIISAFGIISPLAGALLHNIGAFVVLINSARLLKSNTFKKDGE